jgi:hypothetical protein
MKGEMYVIEKPSPAGWHLQTGIPQSSGNWLFWTTGGLHASIQ